MGDSSNMGFRTLRAWIPGILALSLPVAGASPATADAYTYSVTFNGQYGEASGNPVQGEAVVWGSLNTPISVTVKVSSSLPAHVVFLPFTPLNTPPNPLPSGVRFAVTGTGCRNISAPGYWDQAYGCDLPAGTHSVTATYTVASSSPLTGSRVPWPIFSASLYTGDGDEHPGGSCEVKWGATHPGPTSPTTGKPTTSKPTSTPAAKQVTKSGSAVPTTLPTSPATTAPASPATQPAVPPASDPAVTSADASPASVPVTSDATPELATVAEPKSLGGDSATGTLIAALVLAAALGAGLTAFLRFRRRSATGPGDGTGA